MKNFTEAIEALSKKSAERKLHEHLGGSMWPIGQLDIDEILAIIYEVNEEEIEEYFEKRVSKKFDAAWEAHMASYKAITKK